MNGIPLGQRHTLNDVGIVFLGNAPYIISVMTTHLPSLDAGHRFIRGVSRIANDPTTPSKML